MKRASKALYSRAPQKNAVVLFFLLITGIASAQPPTDTAQIRHTDSVIMATLITPWVDTVQKPDWKELYQKIQSKYDSYYADRMTIKAKLFFYFDRDWPVFTANLVEYTQKYVDPSSFKELNRNAQYMADYSNKPSELQKAYNWSKMVTVHEPNNPQYQATMELLDGLVNHRGIRFDEVSSFTAIQAMAKRTHKYVFVDCYATWCGPCRELEKKVMSRKSVGDLFNANFISVRMQMDTSKKKDNALIKKRYADAKTIASDYKVGAYPTLLFFSPEGKLMQQSIGYQKPDALMHKATAVIHYNDYTDRLQKYQSGSLPLNDCGDFADSLRRGGLDSLAHTAATLYMDNYLLTKPEQELFNRDNMLFIGRFISSVNDKGFRVFLKDSAKVSAVLHGDMGVRRVIQLIVQSEIQPASKKSGNTPNWEALETQMGAKYGLPGKIATLQERLTAAFNRDPQSKDLEAMLRSHTASDWEKVKDALTEYYHTAGSLNSFPINEMAWNMFSFCNDTAALGATADIMDQYKNNEDPNELDTYANVLYKSGRVQKAIEWEQKVVDMNKESAARLGREPNPDFSKHLQQMKNGDATWSSK